MKQTLCKWHRQPRTINQARTQLGNPVILPASELISLTKWKKRAQCLPTGTTLFVVPYQHPQLQDISRRIISSLMQLGFDAKLVTTE